MLTLNLVSKVLVLCETQGANRTLLRWLKLWDKVVFNRERKVKQKVKVDSKKGECSLEGFLHLILLHVSVLCGWQCALHLALLHISVLCGWQCALFPTL
jgi:hypothetical protein